MAAYDLPAGFEYIHKNTGTNLIDYIGHSQGTLQMFIALAQSN
jgi:lysosomal acid lipase/cholesteryl ester hydrolase